MTDMTSIVSRAGSDLIGPLARNPRELAAIVQRRKVSMAGVTGRFHNRNSTGAFTGAATRSRGAEPWSCTVDNPPGGHRQAQGGGGRGNCQIFNRTLYKDQIGLPANIQPATL